MMMARRQKSFRVYVDILEEDKEKEFDSRSSGISSIGESEEGDHDTFVRVSWPANMEKDSQLSTFTDINEKGGANSTGSDCQNKEHVLGRKDSTCSESNEKLCGYLNKRKIGTKLNQYKRRWFVYSESSCKLVYYKYANDINHLGEIELARAAFTIDAENEKRSNVFRISSNGNVFLLEAPDRQTMMYWLQQLQHKRRQYWQLNSTNSDQLGTIQAPRHSPSQGLLKSKSLPEESSDSLAPGTPSLLDDIEVPAGTVGIQSSETHTGSKGWQNLNDFSFVNLRTEIKNYAHRRKAGKDNLSQPKLGKPEMESPNSPNTSILRRNRNQSLKAARSREPVNNPRQTKSAMSLPFWDHPIVTHRCSRCRQLQENLQYEKEQSEALEEELEATQTVVETLQKHIVGFMNNIGKSVEERVCDQLPPGEVNLGDKPTNGNHSDTQNSIHGDDDSLGDAQCTANSSPQEGAGSSRLTNHDSPAEGNLVSDQRHDMTGEDSLSEQRRIDCLEAEVNDLKDKIEMYQESINSKDSIIMSLTSRVSDLESMMTTSAPRKFSDSSLSSCSSMLPPSEYAKIQEIKDTCEAFRVQNLFLSQEILDLNRLREQDELRERSHKVNYAKLEAQYYCTKSKYLVCLKELEKPKLDGDTSIPLINPDVIKELIEDAMDSESKPVPDRPAIQEHEKYDKYGFWFIPPEAAQDVESRADSLQQKSDQLTAKANALDKEISVQVKWDNFMINLGNRELERTPELKQLVRAGIPIEHREKIWNFCIKCHLGCDRELCGENYYQGLLTKAAMSNSLNPAVTQVELDLLRTLPNNCHYESSSSEGIPKLRNVLLAFSLHDPDIGYCQGLNRLAAIALLFLEEEDAFWCLVTIVKRLLPAGYYSKGLVAAHIDQRVLKDLLQDKMPKLMAMLQHHQIDLAMFTFNWFLTLFVDNAPVETYLKIWDSLLFEGSKVMFRFGVAFIKYCEDDLLKLKDSLSLHNYLRSLGEQITDVNRVSDIAFNTINPFPMKYISSRRQFHMQGVQTDIEEIRKKRVTMQETYKVTTQLDNNNPNQNGVIHVQDNPPAPGGASARMSHYRSLNSDDELGNT